MPLTQRHPRWGRRITPVIALAVMGTFLGVACGDDDGDRTDASDAIASVEQNAPNAGDTGDRTAIPGQETGSGSGLGGGVVRGTVESPTPTASLEPGRGPSGSQEDNLEGDRAELASDLTAGMQAHVYLVSLFAQALKDNDQARANAAQQALQANADAVATSIAALGADHGQARDTWAEHVAAFEDYARAKTSADDSAASDAQDRLEAWAGDFGQFLAQTSPDLQEDFATDTAKNHVELMTRSIDATLSGDPSAIQLTRESGRALADLAKALSGITES